MKLRLGRTDRKILSSAKEGGKKAIGLAANGQKNAGKAGKALDDFTGGSPESSRADREFLDMRLPDQRQKLKQVD